ncbi:iron ABC transporter permease [Ureibacillus sinduriensis BLB-1 = JCM 15800]|uniref:Iron ABC transporter permease n=2 Tax=Ureibacillus sinduriensis TaxID=561440 RepID=A0A0A3I6X5_9BACL|nr:iron-siderophore ABC transporter substrate-binding protein [Ureibacillus sinduriensis]KGR79260.1 iron ABC transporter permease [Ureibacillus sinduriensis BLB-1 = JCM 15800]
MKKSLLLMLLSLMAIFALTACSDSETESQSDQTSATETAETTDTTEESEATYPITIKHALGEAIIEKKPERIVTIQWGNHDVALALGVVPVGFSAANFGVQDDTGLLPWTKQKLEELGVKEPNVFMDTDGLDFEAIADAQPDVILAAYSGITAEDYELLTQIAPVVAYPEAPWATTWRESVDLISKGMGIETEGEQLIDDIENMLKEKLKEYPQIKGKKVAWVNFSVNDLSKLHIYTPIDARVAFLEELGLTHPESITSLIEDPTKYSLNLSAENSAALNDVDVIVGYGDDELLAAIQADAILGKIPAVANGAVAFITADTPLVAAGTPNPLSIAYTIDDYLALIGSAIDKANK